MTRLTPVVVLFVDESGISHYSGDGCAAHKEWDDVYLCETVTIREISAKLDVPIKTIHRWIQRRHQTSFPEPIWSEDKTLSLYMGVEVEAWYAIWLQIRNRGSGIVRSQ